MDDNFLLNFVEKKLVKSIVIGKLERRENKKPVYFKDIEKIFNGYGIGHPLTTIILREMVKDETIKLENGSYELV